MTDPKKISILDYTYSLPDDRIAKYPLAERDASKLLVYDNGEITEDVYKRITQYIPQNSLLIFNNTKVVEARLLFKKESGSIIEIFCLEPGEQYADITSAMLQKEKVFWKCMVGGFSKWKRGQILEKKIRLNEEEIVLYAVYKEKSGDAFIIELSWTPISLSFAEILHLAGAIPLPPYIKRAPDEADTERYQTVYAKYDGSVAAPTAGLHFTKNIFADLQQKDIQTDFVTLHVGAGTFKPVKAATMLEHEMHAEWIDVSKTTIENLLQYADRSIIAVGTTSLRTLESLYWLGVKREKSIVELARRSFREGGSPQSIVESESTQGLSQWEVYELMKKDISVKDALQSLLDWMNENKMERLITRTQILIAPGYEFKIVNGLVTNFHQPQSTLLLLVAALIGEDWKKVYSYALKNDFRFLSYGDGCLLWRKND